ncbi:MAG: hypothetical protein ABSG35_10360 [Syntrophobacteraceae bacterium]|jgi:hypothetical protein
MVIQDFHIDTTEYFGQPEKIPLADIISPVLNNPRPAFDEAVEDFEIGPAAGKPLTGDRINVNLFKTGHPPPAHRD